jgi:hypothetical protein
MQNNLPTVTSAYLIAISFRVFATQSIGYYIPENGEPVSTLQSTEPA